MFGSSIFLLSNTSPWPLLVSNLIKLSVGFTFFVSCLSGLFLMYQARILKSSIVKMLLQNFVIQRFAAFCVIFARFFFSIRKVNLALFLLLDFFIVVGFLFIRLSAIRISVLPHHWPLSLTLILSLFAMSALILRTILRFGAFIDINKAIDFTSGPSFEAFIFITKNVFKKTINHIPPMNTNTPQYISYMAKATLGAAIIGTCVTGGIYYESRLVRLAAERSADIAQRSADIAAFNQGLIDKQTYYDRNPEDRPKT